MIDLVLRGLVVDGTGGPAYDGWVGISGDRLSAVEAVSTAPPPGVQVVDVPALSPGFIDVHTHTDVTALLAPGMDSQLRQGVTTVVVGNCGTSPGPLPAPATAGEAAGDWAGDALEGADLRWQSLGEWLAAVESVRPALNVVPLVGFGTLRRAVMADPLVAATPEDIAHIRRTLQVALDEGAAGLSTGLIYEPDQRAGTAEIASVVQGMRGVYATHVRGEGAGVSAAVAEAVAIGRAAGVRVQVSHLKCESAHSWGQLPQLLSMLRDARADGVDVGADSYPYTAWETGLAALLPTWCPPDQLAAVYASDRARLRDAVEHGEPGWQSSVDGVGWDRIVVDLHRDADMHGRSLAELADSRDPFDVAVELLLADPGTVVVGHAMREDDVVAAIAAEDVAVASDGIALPVTGPLAELKLHPRCWGTFPRVLGPYVRDGVVPLATAVRKMTSLPAERFGLTDRGTLRVGAVADVVAFDPVRVDGPATFGDASAPPIGITTVLVGGQVAWSADNGSGARRGQVLR